MITDSTNTIVVRDPLPRINYGWTCPKCNKVWNPSETGCRNCNQYYPSVDPYTVPDPTPWTWPTITPYPLENCYVASAIHGPKA